LRVSVVGLYKPCDECPCRPRPPFHPPMRARAPPSQVTCTLSEVVFGLQRNTLREIRLLGDFATLVAKELGIHPALPPASAFPSKFMHLQGVDPREYAAAYREAERPLQRRVQGTVTWPAIQALLKVGAATKGCMPSCTSNLADGFACLHATTTDSRCLAAAHMPAHTP
jgi:hypothetical protein